MSQASWLSGPTPHDQAIRSNRLSRQWRRVRLLKTGGYFWPIVSMTVHSEASAAIWLVGLGHLSVPASYRTLVSAVLMLRDPTVAAPPPWPLKIAARWDRSLVERYSEACMPSELRGGDAVIASLKLSGSVVISSLDLDCTLAIQRQIARPVYWVSIDRHGATDPTALWPTWIADRPSFHVMVSIIDRDGIHELGQREFRVTKSSPLVGQYESLRGAATLLSSDRCENTPKDSKSADISSFVVASPRPQVMQLSVLRRILVRRIANRLFPQRMAQWHVGVAPRSSIVIGEHGPSLPRASNIKWMKSSSDRFIADPFLLEIDRRTILFFEEVRYSERRGRLKAVALDSFGRAEDDEFLVLERPYHLSFPNAFRVPEHTAAVYLLPEQSASGRTVLYRSAPFNSLKDMYFEPHSVLLETFSGIDPVLQWVEPHWYLFASDGAYGNHDNNLHLFFSRQLEGPYKEHPLSPIHQGLRGSRMAGQFLTVDGHLIRLGQDCRNGYGSGIVIFRIDEITPNAYLETEVESLNCTDLMPSLRGLHSFTVTGELVGIDVLRPANTHP